MIKVILSIYKLNKMVALIQYAPRNNKYKVGSIETEVITHNRLSSETNLINWLRDIPVKASINGSPEIQYLLTDYKPHTILSKISMDYEIKNSIQIEEVVDFEAWSKSASSSAELEFKMRFNEIDVILLNTDKKEIRVSNYNDKEISMKKIDSKKLNLCDNIKIGIDYCETNFNMYKQKVSSDLKGYIGAKRSPLNFFLKSYFRSRKGSEVIIFISDQIFLYDRVKEDVWAEIMAIKDSVDFEMNVYYLEIDQTETNSISAVVSSNGLHLLSRFYQQIIDRVLREHINKGNKRTPKAPLIAILDNENIVFALIDKDVSSAYFFESKLNNANELFEQLGSWYLY